MYWVNTMVYMKTELYRTNTKSQGLVPAYFALIISIVVHVVKHQSVLINTCRRQESLRMMQGSPSIIIALNCSCYHNPISLDYSVFLGCTSMISLSGYMKARARMCTPRALVICIMRLFILRICGSRRGN